VLGQATLKGENTRWNKLFSKNSKKLEAKVRQLVANGSSDIEELYIASNIQTGSYKIQELNAFYIKVSSFLMAGSKDSDSGREFLTIVELR
jgi:hypothetical protein